MNHPISNPAEDVQGINLDLAWCLTSSPRSVTPWEEIAENNTQHQKQPPAPHTAARFAHWIIVSGWPFNSGILNPARRWDWTEDLAIQSLTI